MHKVYQDFFGVDNVMGSCIHYDEQHPYTDKDGTRKISLVHAHTLVAAYAEWMDKGKERAGINGKNFMTKARLTGLNKAMCDMVRKKFGIEYNTGAVPTKEKTEKLKADSLKEEVKELSQTVKELEAERELLVTPLENVPEKRLLESQKAFNERLAIEESKKAIEQEKERLRQKEARLEKQAREKFSEYDIKKKELEKTEEGK
jgi:hypothetical protein